MQVITANRLLDGEVVWLGQNDEWVESVSDARVFDGKEAVAEGLALGAAAEKDQKVVSVYEMAVTDEDGQIVPVRLREKIRAAGPTTHPDLGKQAQAVSV